MHPYFQGNLRKIFAVQSGKYPSHFHTNIELAYCFSGSLLIKIGENICTLEPGDAAVILPNIVHEYLGPPPGTSSSQSVLVCDINLIMHNIPDIITKRADNPIIKAKNVSEYTSLAFKKMIQTEKETELIGWTLIVLSDLLGKMDLSPQKSAMDLPSKIVSYINTNFNEPLTLKYIASKFGYHPSYISHLFCDQLRIPFHSYLGAVRSEHAATLIKTTNKSLTDIANECGYNSLNTFCNCFKKHFSKTPSQYKKEYK